MIICFIIVTICHYDVGQVVIVVLMRSFLRRTNY